MASCERLAGRRCAVDRKWPSGSGVAACWGERGPGCGGSGRPGLPALRSPRLPPVLPCAPRLRAFARAFSYPDRGSPAVPPFSFWEDSGGQTCLAGLAGPWVCVLHSRLSFRAGTQLTPNTPHNSWFCFAWLLLFSRTVQMVCHPRFAVVSECDVSKSSSAPASTRDAGVPCRCS